MQPLVPLRHLVGNAGSGSCGAPVTLTLTLTLLPRLTTGWKDGVLYRDLFVEGARKDVAEVRGETLYSLPRMRARGRPRGGSALGPGTGFRACRHVRGDHMEDVQRWASMESGPNLQRSLYYLQT